MSQLDDFRNSAFTYFNHLSGNMDAAGKTTSPVYPNPNVAGGQSNNYWQIGNVFDTMTDYLYQDANSGSPKVNSHQIASFMKNSLDLYYYLVLKNHNGCWYDDFAWWGIACSKAFDSKYDSIFGVFKLRYQQVALSTWDIMKNGKYDDVHHGAPNAWATCDQETFSICRPRFNGGVWQYDIFADKRPKALEPSPSNPSTPIAEGGYQAAGLGPFQDTVVNGLYFVMANRMVAAGWETQQTVDAIYNFTNSWLNDASLDAGTRWCQDVTGGKLMRERVSTYSNPSDKVHGFIPELSWSGDQGLLMAALSAYDKNSSQPWIENMVLDIMNGMAGSVKETNGANTYIMPWYPLTNNHLDSIDPGDYCSGLGVFMRYLNEVYLNDATVKAKLDDVNNPMRTLVVETATTVQNDALPDWLPNWDQGDIFGPFNKLSAMVTAISILQ